MTEHERRLVLPGMSIARGLLINTPCTHHGLIKTYQKALAEAWKIDDSGAERQAEFRRLVAEMNEAIAATYPDAANIRDIYWQAVEVPQLIEKPAITGAPRRL